MVNFRKIAQFVSMLAIVLVCAMSAQAQVTTGNVRGVVTDPNGAVVPNAKVTITQKSTNTSLTTQTTDNGEYQFNNLLAGEEYSITIEAQNFKTLTLTEVRVQLNQVTDIPTQLTIGAVGETVEVTAGGAELVDTTTTNLSESFSSRQVVELAQTNAGGVFGGGVNNLALIAPNVSSSGGVGVGSGGAVGGQRPRNNNFIVDGVDNNDKSVTGPQVYVSPEVVSEFSLLQNQFSAEFGRSNGGQFITVTKSGTNEYHGSAYFFGQNRHLDALDNLQKRSGVIRERIAGREDDYFPRSDFFRTGGNIGGPLHLPRFGEGGPSYYSGKDKLFFFTSYERLAAGAAASAGGLTAPTAAGLAMLSALPGVSANNLNVFRSFVPVAGANDAGTIEICAVARTSAGCPNNNFINVPVGNVNFPAPNFQDNKNFVLNIDYTQSDKTQHRARFNYNNFSAIDTGAFIPVFFVQTPNEQRLFSYTLLHTFSPNLTNETRLAYRRSVSDFPVPDSPNFPGLTDTTFPNIGLLDLGFDLGPNSNFPQFGFENNYQVVNNVSYLVGRHSIKFGADFRNLISPQSFVQRQRGDYQYTATDIFLRDQTPDFLAQRTVGASPYYGNQKLLFSFFQDDWRIRPNVTLNLGLNHSYQGVPLGAKLQGLNALSSVPGLIEFREPEAQKYNFAPKVGIAYSPDFNEGLLGSVFGTGGKSSIRAGFSLGYDYIFDNLYILALPPQANQTVDADINSLAPNFLGSGAIPNIPLPLGNDPAEARSVTSAFIPDQEVPYSITYTLSFQRQFLQNYSMELRYLGTRGVHLLTQNRINQRARVSPEDGRPGLPTFFSSPSQAQLDALPLTLTQILARDNILPSFRAAGLSNPITGFLSNGNSSYHGFSAQLQRRFVQGIQFTSAYTWSHLIDDTTAEVFSTVLSPRRVEDFQNLRRERADSALDRRHRFVFSGLYELPFFKNSGNAFARSVLGGFNFAGTLTFESGQKATVLSGTDSNLNGDAAPDRTIRNPGGVRGRASTVTPLLNSSGATVGYLVDQLNPNGEYIQAGRGALSTSARNTLQLPGINNLDFSVFKNFRMGETRRIQIRADLFNAFNHPQYIPGSPNTVAPFSTTGVADVNTVGRASFNRPDEVFSSNSRVIQLALRFDF